MNVLRTLVYSKKKKKEGKEKERKKKKSEAECWIFTWLQAQWGKYIKVGKYFGRLVKIRGEREFSEFSLFPLLVVAIVFPFLPLLCSWRKLIWTQLAPYLFSLTSEFIYATCDPA